MRVSTRYQFDNLNRQIQSAQDRYFKAQKEVMTGKRDDILSSDPGGAGRMLRTYGLKAATQQYDQNLRSAKDYLTFTEQAITDTGDLLKSAYTTALQAANSSTDQAGRNGMAAQIQTLQDRLLRLANTQNGAGQYVFGGQKNSTQPYSSAAGVLSYSGDANSVMVETGPGQTVAVNTIANTQFATAYQNLETLRTNLIGGNISAISGSDVQNLQDSMASFRTLLGLSGAAHNQVTALKDHNTRRIEELTVKISDIEEVDMADAVANYRLAETAYQAALQVTSTSNRMSLLDYMR